LAEVRNFSDRPANCRLSLALDGKPVETAPVSVARDGRWQRVFEVAAPAGSRLTARLDPPDAYPADNTAAVTAPPVIVPSAAAEGDENAAFEAALAASPPVGPTGSDHVDLRGPAALGVDAASVVVARPWPPIWTFAAGLALAILVFEWCCYQRRWMT
jgi:hypothetical protein